MLSFHNCSFILTDRLMYWTDLADGRLYKSSLDGSNRNSLYQYEVLPQSSTSASSASAHYYGLVQSGEFIYFTTRLSSWVFYQFPKKKKKLSKRAMKGDDGFILAASFSVFLCRGKCWDWHIDLEWDQDTVPTPHQIDFLRMYSIGGSREG